ncbi:MAG: hypothetical protein AAGD25_17925 [Cyanobacteria bacterium P01_F01_bin.150]
MTTPLRTELSPPLSSRLKQHHWKLDTILPLEHTIPKRYFQEAPEDVVQNFCHLLSRDVYSEGDSQVLYDYIQSRRGEMSDTFLRMIDLWLADELKHYQSLRRVYHCIAGISFAEMNQCFSQRTHDFSPIQMILKDELTILLSLMFDEIGSVYSYRRDLKEYYSHFGPEIRKIGQQLVRDEQSHFNNAAEVILQEYQHRLSEVRPFLTQLSELEDTLHTYHKTFFLDHAQEKHRFPPCFNSVIIQVILARLGLEQRPKAKQINYLWQWVPEGHTLVPVFAE